MKRENRSEAEFPPHPCSELLEPKGSGCVNTVRSAVQKTLLTKAGVFRDETVSQSSEKWQNTVYVHFTDPSLPVNLEKSDTSASVPWSGTEQCALSQPALSRFEFRFSGTTDRTEPVRRQVGKCCTGGYAALFVAFCRIVFVTTDFTNVYLHDHLRNAQSG